MRVLLKYVFIIFFLTFCITLPRLNTPQIYEYVPLILEEPSLIPLEQQLLDSMDISQKVGQLFMVGFNGTEVSIDTLEWIQNKHIGGVLLLGRNVENEQQLKKLTDDLQTASDIPLFIAIDQEGGTVSRLKWNPVLTTSQKDIESSKQMYDVAKERAKILKSVGINMNLAPVVEHITDASSFMYKRVFEGDVYVISDKALAAISGYSQQGIIPVPKHYPGHSNTSPDSHQYLPKVNITPLEWDSYIYPFKTLIEQKNVDILMVGHILYPNIDSKVSTISNEILDKRLRKDLDFTGVLLSDDMEMKAIKNEGEERIVAKQSLIAGMDILIYSSANQEQKVIYEYILNTFREGEIDIQVLNEKVLRILELKKKYNMLKDLTNQLPLE